MVLLLTLLPVGIGLLFAVHFALAFIQFELRQNHSCRTALIPAQNQAGEMLGQLLNLNPEAAELRVLEFQAKLLLQAAIASENPPAIASAKLYLNSIQTKRSILGQKQKQLIRAGDQMLNNGFWKAKTQLMKDQKDFLPSLRPLLTGEYQPQFGTPSQMAVRPDFPDTAPVYMLKNNFESQQALVQKWQYSFHVHPVLKSFLQGHFAFAKDCSVTLEQRNLKWTAKIQKAKSLAKSPW